MFEVKATANGYYGEKFRTPGEPFGIAELEDFSVRWMTSDDPKVIAYVGSLTRLKVETKSAEVLPEEKAAIDSRVSQAKKWLKDHGKDDGSDPIETRRVNTGGTDGVVGADVPKPGQKLSAPERVAAAKALTGRDDITTAKEADAILAAAQPLAGSDNDDRARDLAIDQSQAAPVDSSDI